MNATLDSTLTSLSQLTDRDDGDGEIDRTFDSTTSTRQDAELGPDGFGNNAVCLVNFNQRDGGLAYSQMRHIKPSTPEMQNFCMGLRHKPKGKGAQRIVTGASARNTDALVGRILFLKQQLIEIREEHLQLEEEVHEMHQRFSHASSKLEIMQQNVKEQSLELNECNAEKEMLIEHNAVAEKEIIRLERKMNEQREKLGKMLISNERKSKNLEINIIFAKKKRHLKSKLAQVEESRRAISWFESYSLPAAFAQRQKWLDQMRAKDRAQKQGRYLAMIRENKKIF